MSVDFANPTGETMARQSRIGLLDLADDLGIAVVEDAAYQALRYEGDAIPPILALDLERAGHIDRTRTIYCGTFSKTLSPGLRVGWVCAAAPVIAKLVLIKQASDLHSATLNQMAIHEVASRGFEKQVSKVCGVYSQRRDCMLTALEAYMPPDVSWSRPEGGMFVWVTLPSPIDGATLLAKSLETQRVAFVPGRAFFADGSNGNTLRLSFSLNDEDTIDEGIQRLGRLIESEL